MTYIDDVANYLESLGLGTVGIDIFTFDMPNEPDTCTCLEIRGGMAPDPITTMERPGVRVLCRDEDSDDGKSDAYAKAYAIKKALHRLVGVTMGTTPYHRIDAQGEPVFNAKDSRGRPIYEVSFICIKEEE